MSIDSLTDNRANVKKPAEKSRKSAGGALMNAETTAMISRLTRLAEHLRRCAAAMDRFDTLELGGYADQLNGAAMCVDTWIEGIRKEAQS